MADSEAPKFFILVSAPFVTSLSSFLSLSHLAIVVSALTGVYPGGAITGGSCLISAAGDGPQRPSLEMEQILNNSLGKKNKKCAPPTKALCVYFSFPCSYICLPRFRRLIGFTLNSFFPPLSLFPSNNVGKIMVQLLRAEVLSRASL